MRFLLSLTAFLFAPAAVLAAFGYTDDGTNYVVDTGANLVVKVSKANGDMTSIKYNGIEYSGQGGKNSQVESGLGASTVSIKRYTLSNSAALKISVAFGTLRHYLVFRYNNPNVYIFMNKPDDSVTVSRYIVRIPANVFKNNVNTDTDWVPDGATVIESGDVVGLNGQTWSKHYSGLKYGRTIDYDYVGYTNAKVGMYLVRSSHEKASGGPFFRSLVRRGGSGGPDLYDIYNYNMGHTDVMRLGLQGPSVLTFTDNGAAPNSALFARNADWGWMDTLEISGWVPASGRGSVAGVGIANVKAGTQYVVGLKNNNGQYWTKYAGSGTYTLIVWKDELEVYTGSVTISAGATATVNTLTCVDPADTTAIWRIGTWDGTPKGFLNFGDTPMKPTYMHPSDSRLLSWKPTNFIIGTTATSGFPGYMWKDINNDHLVYFRLSSSQIAQSFKIRVGVTEGMAGGRPTVSVNGWTAALQGDKGQADTRSLTVGTYRGNNYIYEFTVPASAWLQSARDWQILKVSVISGKVATGYLSPGVSFDALDMVNV